MGIKHKTNWIQANMFPYIVFFWECHGESFTIWSNGRMKSIFGKGPSNLVWGFTGTMTWTVQPNIREGYV